MVFENKKKGTRQKKELPVCTKNDVYLQTYRYSIMRKASEKIVHGNFNLQISIKRFFRLKQNFNLFRKAKARKLMCILSVKLCLL